jgi:predicted RNA-binding protein (virulence factor B family)
MKKVCYNNIEVIDMAVKVGYMNNLEVVRDTDIAYILTDGQEEVFLHKKQAEGSLEVGEKIDVFLYYDNQKRVTATMKKPLVDTEHPAFVEVVDTNYKLGAFLNIGLIKDLLLSRDDLPFRKKEWPKRGDQLFVRMRVSKNQLTAKLIARGDIASYLQPSSNLMEGEHYKAYVVFFAEEGVVFTTKEGHSIFVYFKHMRDKLRLGQEVDVKILLDKGDYAYNGTLIKQKELMLDEDANRIKTYLEEHDGFMPYHDKSSPEDIKEVFGMSKAAFKRAIGTLYKEKMIAIEDKGVRIRKSVE